MSTVPFQAPLSSPFLVPVTFPNLTEQCLSSNIAKPTLFGAEVMSVTSSLVTNYTASFLPPMFFNSDPPLYDPVQDLSFCNVTVTYTHPGHDDTINVNIWLPLSILEEAYFNSTTTDPHTPDSGKDTTSPAWNGILLSHGGGGFSTCLPDLISHTALTQGYAISRTDGGHPPITVEPPDGTVDLPTAESWALLSPGNVNLYKFQDFASTALHDLSIISKSVVHSFYGIPARHSYFQGCSTGGRQALMLAQRFPTDYDGILSAAPAIYFAKLLVSHWLGQALMQSLSAFPKACELEYLTQAAIEECDPLDGIIDGIISNDSACNFDPFPSSNPNLRGEIPCLTTYADHPDPIHEKVTISHAAAYLAYHLWGGSSSSPPLLSHPHHFTHSAPLPNLAATICFHTNNTCIPNPEPLSTDWFRIFLYKDPSLTTSDLLKRLTILELNRLLHVSDQEYHSLISTSDPDLSTFAAHGGKLLLWHGTADEGIPSSQSTEYFLSVQEFVSRNPHLFSSPSSHSSSSSPSSHPSPPTPTSPPAPVTDFLRYFLPPGIQHCGSGDGILPINALTSLRLWLENGQPPETLQGESFGRKDGRKLRRRVCLFPRVARWMGREGEDVDRAEGWECV